MTVCCCLPRFRMFTKRKWRPASHPRPLKMPQNYGCCASAVSSCNKSKKKRNHCSYLQRGPLAPEASALLLSYSSTCVDDDNGKAACITETVKKAAYIKTSKLAHETPWQSNECAARPRLRHEHEVFTTRPEKGQRQITSEIGASPESRTQNSPSIAAPSRFGCVCFKDTASAELRYRLSRREQELTYRSKIQHWHRSCCGAIRSADLAILSGTRGVCV